MTVHLWDELVEKYGMTNNDGVQKIVFPGGLIEAFQELSFAKSMQCESTPNMLSRIESREVIEGLPFDTLKIFFFSSENMLEKKT